MYKILIVLVVLSSLLLAGCSSSSSGLERLEGQIVWEDGGTLPAGSTVSVQIVNASLADATETLAQTSFNVEGSPPLNFFVEYDPANVDDRMNYSATVRIEDSDGQLLYITKTAQFVIENGQQVEDIKILVEPV
jgi:uncharacterized lipoprotein YbaY